MSRKRAEGEFILISEAVTRLEAGMFSGGAFLPEAVCDFRRPEAVVVAKKSYPGASIGWGPQREDAAKRIYGAIKLGELSVFALRDPPDREADRAPLQVPLGVLKQMIFTRGGLSDRAVQPLRIRAKGTVAPELLATLSTHKLYLRREEFDAWYKKAKEKGNWPSQRSSRKPRMGRPPKQNDLRAPIDALVNEKLWSARQKIADLVRLLESRGIIAARDTVRRIVDQILKETGKQSYRRRVRKRSQVNLNGPR